MDAIDPVTLVVVQNGLQQVASEMDLTFERAAFSPVISEGFDRSDGIYDKDTGDVIAQGELGLPIFVGVMQFTTRAVIEHVKQSGEPLRPGDIFIVNDPYCGGTHLMDVKMVKPFFYGGSCGRSCPTPATGPTPGARCRAASRRAPPRCSRKGSGCRRSSCTAKASCSPTSCRSSSPTSGCPRSASATSRPRPPASPSARSASPP